MRTNVIVALGFLLVLASGETLCSQTDTAPKAAAQLWPGFRGVGGNGHAVDANPPVTWSAKDGKNILWKTAVVRHGMSSPVVAGNRLFVTAADHFVRQVLCYDTDTGKLLWEHGVTSVAEEDLPRVLDETGYAAPTAVTNGELVAAVFATGELVCLNVNGKRVWEKQLGVPKNHYGHASSLVRFKDLVIVQLDHAENAKLLAFDFASSKLEWQVERDAISWSSPIVVDNNGRMEVILTNSKSVDSYDPNTGKHLWQVDCLDGEVAPSAAYADGIAFVASEGATAAAIGIGEHNQEPKILWQWDESLPDSASPVATKKYLILPTAYGLVTCLSAKTGEVYWEHEYDRGFSSSPILVNDRVYIADLSGTMQTFRIGREFEHVGEGSIGEPAYATAAFVGDRIYIRGVTHLFCIANQEEADGKVPTAPSQLSK